MNRQSLGKSICVQGSRIRVDFLDFQTQLYGDGVVLIDGLAKKSDLGSYKFTHVPGILNPEFVCTNGRGNKKNQKKAGANKFTEKEKKKTEKRRVSNIKIQKKVEERKKNKPINVGKSEGKQSKNQGVKPDQNQTRKLNKKQGDNPDGKPTKRPEKQSAESNRFWYHHLSSNIEPDQVIGVGHPF